MFEAGRCLPARLLLRPSRGHLGLDSQSQGPASWEPREALERVSKPSSWGGGLVSSSGTRTAARWALGGSRREERRVGGSDLECSMEAPEPPDLEKYVC